jgi:hypothetical protein
VAKAGGAHGFGYLSVTCKPDCDVEIDNQESHHSPVVKLKLPAGSHRLRMVNHQVNLSTTDTIQVEPEGSLVRSYNLVMDVRGH